MPTTQKTKTILFRVSECDYALLVQAAGQLTLSAYIRAILFNQELPKARAHKKPLKDQEQLSKALGLMMQSRLAPNLNQIAKAVNCGLVQMPDEAIETLCAAQHELHEIRTLLLGALGKKAQ